MVSSGVNQHVKVRHRKVILRIGFVKISKIHTNAYLLILFPYLHNICQPSYMNTRFDETHFNQFLQLLFYLKLDLVTEISYDLLNKLKTRIGNQFVSNEFTA